MKIRSHLLLLAAGAMIPLLAFAVLVSVVLLERDRATVQRAASDRARAMMTAVDAELRGSVATLDAVGASAALAAGDLRAFHGEASRVLGSQPQWLYITLVSPAGEKLLDASQPFGTALSQAVDRESIARTVATRQPAIGRIDVGAGGGIPIRVPVLHDGAVAYVVTAFVQPGSFENLIRQQRLPDGWISGIVDSSGRFVARVPTRPAGELASADFRAAVLKSPEGWYRGRSVEGKDVFTAHQVSQFSNWSIGLAIPAEIVLTGVRSTALMIGIGVLSSIAVALAIVLTSGRRIVRSIVSLAAAARSIGSGDRAIDAVPGEVDEVSDVAIALRDADAVVRERQSLIQRERDAMQEADRAKDEFIAALSHELRNPLAAMSAASHILRIADPSAAAATDARGVIERQTRHMSRMIEDLLDVSRIIMGKAKLTLERIDLTQLVAHSVAAWSAAGRFAGRSTAVELDSAWVTADRTRVEQILSNLLDNAVKFTPPDARITISVARDGDAGVLTVADDGPGIAPGLGARVFDLFVQAEQGMGRVRGGIGVGLTLVKRLAELQRGSVTAASGPAGRGAVFTVRLPAAAAPTIAAEDEGTATPDAVPRRILIVEDNRDARDMLRQVLEMNGHDVVEAVDGASATALAIENRPEVAIVDIGLPDMSGYDVARRIRAELDGAITLVALTGYGQPEDRQRALSAGFDVHLVKPIGLDRLEEIIARASTSPAPASIRAER
ncbi:MAG TPA: ATP-binding protein [Casimicrobiaceae bacterium]|nr:ATP-binding protein [Casimicrobiaceae bacterium]